ncbi:MAG: hypothetical protein WKF63_03805 [Thermomicrobiales bacterium]
MAEPRLWQQVNEHYPGRWAASVQSLVADGDSVVTLTEISDGSINVVAISFFTVQRPDYQPGGILARALRPA